MDETTATFQHTDFNACTVCGTWTWTAEDAQSNQPLCEDCTNAVATMRRLAA